MPIYEYRCGKGHTFEVLQRMSDDPLSACQVCDAPVQRVFHPVAVHFKGSGFYNTDYGKRRRGGESQDGAAPADGGSGSDAAKDTGSGVGKDGEKGSGKSAPKAGSGSAASSSD